MKRIVAGTARFKAVVQECGAPRTATLWVKPEQDRTFMAAVKAQRVMTVVRENVGTRKDFGLAGFHPGPNAVYLIFPRSLDSFEGRRIVGIDLDLIDEPEALDPVRRGRLRPPTGPRRNVAEVSLKSKIQDPKAGAKPALNRYSVKVKLIATAVQVIEVEARTKAEAMGKATRLQAVQPDWSRAKLKKTALAVTAL